MAWHLGHNAQHLANEIASRAHIEDAKRKVHEANQHWRYSLAKEKKRPSIFRRILRRIRGGSD